MFTAVDAKQVAQSLFGVTGSTTRLPGEYDCNFHLKTADGNEFLLKISHPNEQENIVAMQTAVLQWLQTSSRTFHTPMPQSTLTGAWVGTLNSPNGNSNLVRLFTFVPGNLFADIRYHSPELLTSLGQQLGHLTLALSDFQHPAATRSLKWDLKQCHWIKDQLTAIEDSKDQCCVAYFYQKYESDIAAVLPNLRQSVIHGDINDNNILVTSPSFGSHQVSGFIDFGDLVETATICELAIAVTYAILHKPDPLAAAAQIVKGYHAVFPLQEAEIDILFDLICMRLCASVVNSALRKKENPNDDYLTISEKPAWEILRKLREVHPRFACYTFRDACQLPPCPQTAPVTDWLAKNAKKIGSLLETDLSTAAVGVLDLSPGSIQIDLFDETIADMRDAGAEIIVGQYNEARLIYSNPQYQLEGNDGPEARTVHLGLDIMCAANTPVYAPIPGTIHSFADNDLPQDYGPTIILEHYIADEKITFYTLYGHLNRESLAAAKIGKVIAKGEVLGWLGETHVNGGWMPHLHFQIIVDPLDHKGNFPGVTQPSKKPVWLSICPDPNLITRIPTLVYPKQNKMTKSDIQTHREKDIGKNVGLSYLAPLEIVRGKDQYLYDENGRSYLDCVNNVAHVGHCHPKVVRAGQRQMALLNTNTRYLHENLAHYAKRLLAKMPAPLEVCFFACSGSEANELALRLALTHTRRKGILVLEHGYHGNTSTLVNISPYKFNGPGGKGQPDFVHMLPMPDPLRDLAGPVFQTVSPSTGAFICEPLLSCGGQIVLPDGYLQRVYADVRKVGGVCIADEVQVGLGRVGSHFWGFETQGVVPDIVTIGKPLGNGHPLSAVITTRAIADSFCNGMEYFNTFGGNPVSCAIGLAVLDVIEDERLQDHALQIGNYLKQKLNILKDKYASIGDVRGLGLFLGIEFVVDKQCLIPAKDLSTYVVNRMKDRGILLSTDGPFKNVIKIKPPMVFNQENCDFLVSNLDYVLSTCG